ncbi:glycosyltransferase family 2 protein [Roseovarius ramblicola]|uniref:Glycosyltransferase family 2 protein n=1 Tax=Roseovarius ramblicola TaxID=2022336 RepID=A0ABV5I1Y1_9RHOB
MTAATLKQFLAAPGTALAKGPVAMIFAEDETEIDSTLRHHLDLGFRSVLLFAPDAFATAPDVISEPTVRRIRFDTASGDDPIAAVNAVAAAAPGRWMYYCYNAEYLFYPFCETRTIGDLLTFHTEERRDAMLTYVIDLYAPDLGRHPDAVSLEEAQLDRSGYYALGRPDPGNHNHPRERQLDFHGGLRWRFEEHIPPDRRKIDRIALFRAQPDVTLRADHTFSDEEYNTYACPWHNSLTAAIASFRTAKALKSNPGSTFDIATFTCHNSVPFEWHSRQLLDLGLIEPGQWF